MEIVNFTTTNKNIPTLVNFIKLIKMKTNSKTNANFKKRPVNSLLTDESEDLENNQTKKSPYVLSLLYSFKNSKDHQRPQFI